MRPRSSPSLLRRPDASLLSVAAAGLFAALLPGCSSQKACLLVACESSATLRVLTTVSAADLPRAQITACKGTPAACASGRVNNVPAAKGDRLPFSISGSVDVKGTVLPADGGGYVLELVYNLEGQITGDTDRFEVKVVLDGNPVTQLAETAKYETTQPNGPDCPPVCKNVVIDKSRG